MTRTIKSIESNRTLLDASRLMVKLDVGFLPVVDNDNLVGVLTDRDIVIALNNGFLPNSNIKDIMSREIHFLSSDKEVSEACDLMSQKQIRRIPIVDDNKLVGIVSLADLTTNDYFFNYAMAALANISYSPQRNYIIPQMQLRVDDFPL